MDELSILAQCKDLLKEVYQDLATPGVQNVGKALGTVLGLGNTVLLPLHLANEKAAFWARRNLDLYRQKLVSKSLNQVTEPPVEIAVPILEKLLYVRDEDIAKLYANLLATSSTVEHNKCAHPSFVKIIENLSPDEARIIEWLASSHVIPYETLNVSGGKDNKGYDRRRRIVVFPTETNLAFYDKATMYSENLESLGLTEDLKEPLARDEWYVQVIKTNNPYFKKWQEEQPDLAFTRIRGHYRITSFGVEFVIACGHDSPIVVESLRRFMG